VGFLELKQEILFGNLSNVHQNMHSENLTDFEIIQLEILIKLISCDFNNLLQLIDTVLSDQSKLETEKINWLKIYKARSSFFTDNVENFKNLLLEIEKDFKKLEKKYTNNETDDWLEIRGEFHNTYGIYYRYKGEYDNAISEHQKANFYFDQMKNSKLKHAYITSSYIFQGIIYLATGHFKSVNEMSNQVLQDEYIVENLIASVRASILKNKMFQSIGEYETSLREFQNLNKISKANEFLSDEGYTHLSIAQIYRELGEYAKALEHIKSALEIYENIGDHRNSANCYESRGQIYYEQGEMDLALDNFQKDLAMRVKLNDMIDMAMAMKDIALVNYQKKKETNAISYFIQAYELSKSIGNHVVLSDLIYYIITLSDKITPELQEYIDKMEVITSENEDNKIINLKNSLIQAHKLKTSKRVVDKFKAQKIYIDIVNSSTIINEQVMNAYVNLFELLLMELRISGEESEEILLDIHNISTKLTSFIHQTKSAILKIKSLLLQSQFNLLEQKIEEAQDRLDQALELAEEKEMKLLSFKILEEKQKITDAINKWVEIIEKNKLNFEEIKREKIIDYLKDASKVVDKF
jgi:tetratricopeptide (TPR) repeat protein